VIEYEEPRGCIAERRKGRVSDWKMLIAGIVKCVLESKESTDRWGPGWEREWECIGLKNANRNEKMRGRF